jgi:hypothetical protein
MTRSASFSTHQTPVDLRIAITSCKRIIASIQKEILLQTLADPGHPDLRELHRHLFVVQKELQYHREQARDLIAARKRGAAEGTP